MDDMVSVERQDAVAVVRMDRPPANAMNAEFLEAGRGVLDQLRKDLPGAVVLTGRPGFFCAGADLKEVPLAPPEEQRRMVNGINGLCAAWYAFPRPVVCAVNGHAIAGGLVWALCGDYRVASDAGKYGLTEVRAGVPYPGAAIAVVRAELAPPAARVLALRGQLYDARAMLELGAFDEVHAPEAVLDRALEVARELAAIPSAVYERTKRQLRGEVIDAVEEITANEGDSLDAEHWIGEETQAAAAAVLRGE